MNMDLWWLKQKPDRPKFKLKRISLGNEHKNNTIEDSLVISLHNQSPAMPIILEPSAEDSVNPEDVYFSALI